MKNILLLLLLVGFSGACHGFHHDLAGSGKRQKETRAIQPFTSISTEGAFDIEVVCQQELGLEIEGDDNILPLVSTNVSNNVLRIKNDRSYSVREPVRVRISVPDLAGISASGAGAINISGVKNDKFLIDVSGAPTIRASGETKELAIDANGAGKIDVHRLRGARVHVESNGVSTVEVYASDQLDVTVSGPSKVVYHGKPVVTQTVNGPGSVEKAESEGAMNFANSRVLIACVVLK